MKTILILIATITAFFLYSCDDVTKGYLETAQAEYSTDTLQIYLEESPTDSIPWQSESIQGTIGTFPITYEIAAVRDSTGTIVPPEISAQFRLVLKAVIQIERNHTIPVGRYSIDLAVNNIHGTELLPKIFTVIVKRKDE